MPGRQAVGRQMHCAQRQESTNECHKRKSLFRILALRVDPSLSSYNISPREMQGKYIAKKSYHPSSLKNQRKVWEAEEAGRARARDEELKIEELKRRKIEVERGVRASGNDRVGFLYEHLAADRNNSDSRNNNDEIGKRELAVDAAEHGQEIYDRSKLRNERVKNRKLTLVEKFPELRGAPKTEEVKDAENRGIFDQSTRPKPLGKSIRNVKCMRCEKWGHEVGDRECELRDFNPHDWKRLEREDPISTSGRRSPIRGGGSPTDPNQVLIPGPKVDLHFHRSPSVLSKGIRISNADQEQLAKHLAYVKSLSEEDQVRLMEKLNREETVERMRRRERRKKKRRSSLNERNSSSRSPIRQCREKDQKVSP